MFEKPRQPSVHYSRESDNTFDMHVKSTNTKFENKFDKRTNDTYFGSQELNTIIT